MWKKNSNRCEFEKKDGMVRQRVFCRREFEGDGSEDGPGRPVMFWNRLCLQRYCHHPVVLVLGDTPVNVTFPQGRGCIAYLHL